RAGAAVRYRKASSTPSATSNPVGPNRWRSSDGCPSPVLQANRHGGDIQRRSTPGATVNGTLRDSRRRNGVPKPRVGKSTGGSEHVGPEAGGGRRRRPPPDL